MRIDVRIAILAIGSVLCAAVPGAQAAARKVHVVALGAAKRVPYSKAGDPAGSAAAEDALKIRALLVDGVVKEWTNGDAHDVTDRSFVVRRVMRLNDSLPSDKVGHWVWQREPLRVTFHPAGRDPISFDVAPGSAVLVEDAGDEAETPAAASEVKQK